MRQSFFFHHFPGKISKCSTKKLWNDTFWNFISQKIKAREVVSILQKAESTFHWLMKLVVIHIWVLKFGEIKFPKNHSGIFWRNHLDIFLESDGRNKAYINLEVNYLQTFGEKLLLLNWISGPGWHQSKQCRATALPWKKRRKNNE